MKKSWIAVLLLAAGLATQGAHAAAISLDLTTGSTALANNCAALSQSRGCLENGDTVSAGGLTLTFSAVTPHQTPSQGGFYTYIVVDQDGIFFDSDTYGTPDLPSAGSFGISFSEDVYIKSYVIGFDTTSTPHTDGKTYDNFGGFEIGGSGFNNMFGWPAHSTHDFSDMTFLFQAGTIYTVTGSATDLATLAALNVETVGAAVPEPATIALFGLGLAGIGAARRRKRAA